VYIVGSYYTDISRCRINQTFNKQFHVVKRIKASLRALASFHQHTSKDEVVSYSNVV